MKKRALITGITGQDGSYLAPFLLDKGYEVHGIVRRSSSHNTGRIDHLLHEPNLYIHHADMEETSTIDRLIKHIEPDEIYNLAAQSDVALSFTIPQYTFNINGLGTLHILEAIRDTKRKNIRFYQASSSELFGKTNDEPQHELTPFYPRSPYAISKLCAYWLTINYREAYDLFACNGILFNHESPARGNQFVTKKIIDAVIDIICGKKKPVTLGNLEAKRDWGYAKDYVEAMWLMLQQNIPTDYVIATGETHTVRELVETVFHCANITIEWHGEGTEEKGYDKDTHALLVIIDKNLFRPTEVDFLQGNPQKALQLLNWKPKIKFQQLIRMMFEDAYEKRNRSYNHVTLDNERNVTIS